MTVDMVQWHSDLRLKAPHLLVGDLQFNGDDVPMVHVAIPLLDFSADVVFVSSVDDFLWTVDQFLLRHAEIMQQDAAMMERFWVRVIGVGKGM
jgi:hypothetical protein